MHIPAHRRRRHPGVPTPPPLPEEVRGGRLPGRPAATSGKRNLPDVVALAHTGGQRRVSDPLQITVGPRITPGAAGDLHLPGELPFGRGVGVEQDQLVGKGEVTVLSLDRHCRVDELDTGLRRGRKLLIWLSSVPVSTPRTFPEKQSPEGDPQSAPVTRYVKRVPLTRIVSDPAVAGLRRGPSAPSPASEAMVMIPMNARALAVRRVADGRGGGLHGSSYQTVALCGAMLSAVAPCARRQLSVA